ncbi:MAG: YeeE/YedE family protein [Hyphomicrobiaceae bacterium]
MLAGGAARFGRICSMSAIEDAFLGQDFRAAKAWALAVAVAIAATQLASHAGLADVATSHYMQPKIDLLGTLVGAMLFGLGMALAGTCSFGLLVRAGGGDLRAGVTAMIVGISAISFTAGVVAPVRLAIEGSGVIDLAAAGGPAVDRMIATWLGQPVAALVAVAIVTALVLPAAIDTRLRRRPRLLIAAVVLGLAVSLGWAITTAAVDELLLERTESLSFVAPAGRALLQVMMSPFRNVGFGIAAMFGAIAASFLVAALRRELRWEAFDDPTEMRRHLAGGALMGLGGVLAHGCTIGQGLSAASTLTISAVIFVAGALIGARFGLWYLIDGAALWRLGNR